MKITKYGHACLLLEEGGARLLIDPGAFSKGFEELLDLDAILISHQHADHLVVENISALLKHNPNAVVYADEDSAKVLDEQGIKAKAVHDGDEFEVAGTKVAVRGEKHAVIHPEIPGISNVGYLVSGRFFYPGDSFTLPGTAVAVLALPLGAPWLKVSEMVDYARAVGPEVAVPVHDAVLAMPGMHVAHLERLVPKMVVKMLGPGETVEL